MPALVRIAACGDEEGEMEESANHLVSLCSFRDGKNDIVDSQNNETQTRPRLNNNAVALQRAIIGLRSTILLKLHTRITIIIAIIIIITIEIRRVSDSSKTPPPPQTATKVSNHSLHSRQDVWVGS